MSACQSSPRKPLSPKMSQSRTCCKTTSAASRSSVLALIHQLWKLARVVGANVTDVLRLPWIRNEILRQHQRQHFTVTKSWLAAWFSLQQRLSFTDIPVIHHHQDGCQHAYHVYTCYHWSIV